ncbi:hypothetical protein CASFOL_010168 [Castilleja foliolosa]|uniref:WRC domain-containing protein n=1 Tax=Castilleja foliolosa TaxID=1961234 RepID=A0ABD3DSC2_9LAMI
MRIRKHAKIFYATSSLKPPATHVCQLNQSPWDVMNFSPPSTPPPPPPPPPPQVHGDGLSAVNGSLKDCISFTQRDQPEYSGNIPAKITTVKEEAPPPQPVTAERKIILCGKTDGKSWQCKKEAAKGHSLCHHHMVQARSYSKGYDQYMGKKNEKLSGEARRPARTKKASISSNPHEFYYYSGFGPRWGKRRGEACNNTNATTDTATNSNNSGSSSKNVELEDEMSDDESDFDEYEEEEEINNRDDNNNIGKKRVRKPIKERSLKSLM